MIEKNLFVQRNHAIKSSICVALFTALGFFGFFIRDYLMVKVYGFGSVLDSFYLITMLPMYMVSIFCIPFGQTVIPNLNKMLHHNNDMFFLRVRYFSFLVVGICIFLCLLNYLLSNTALYLISRFNLIKLNDDINLMQITILPILFLSGLVILCNSILVIKDRYIYPSIVQITVPISAILFLILLGKLIGVLAVILGMVFGQFINFMFVYFALKKDNVRLFPFEFDFKTSSSFWVDYSHLVLIAFCAASSILINIYMSTTLGPGAASIFNLGTKFSIFFIGTFSVVFSSVLLPYLSKLSLNQDSRMLKSETYALVLSSAFIFIPFSLIIYQNAEWISQIIFGNIVSEASIILGISSVIKYSVIQLPFWVFNSIVFKHANAINQVGIVSISSILLVLLNLLFSWNLIKFMNVGGLAISMTLSTAITSFLMLFYYGYKKHFKFTEVIAISLAWVFFGLILIGLNFVRILDLFNEF